MRYAFEHHRWIVLIIEFLVHKENKPENNVKQRSLQIYLVHILRVTFRLFWQIRLRS